MNRAQVEAAAREMLAADCGCPPVLLDSGGVAVILSRPGRGRSQQLSRMLHLISFGAGVLIACSQEHFDWAERSLATLSRDELFGARCLREIQNRIDTLDGGWRLSEPYIRFLCASDTLTPVPSAEDSEIRTLEPPALEALRGHRLDLPNVFSRGADENAVRLVVAAFREGKLAAAAGACADTPNMWQIGVDTIAPERRKGVGRLVVWQLTQQLLRRNIAPFYATSIANVVSQRLAIGVGYWPAWIELYARPDRETAR